VKPDRDVSALPACSRFRAFLPHLRRQRPSSSRSSPRNDSVPSSRSQRRPVARVTLGPRARDAITLRLPRQ
jgi:hypothetical protein